MKKIALIFFIFLYLAGSNSFADIIKQIKISGNKNVSKETIEVFANIKINDEINEKSINEIIKKIYETSYFSNVKVDFDDQILFIFVEENPIINSITIKGLKADKYVEDITDLSGLSKTNPLLSLGFLIIL